jgi:hypothetical protein
VPDAEAENRSVSINESALMVIFATSPFSSSFDFELWAVVGALLTRAVTSLLRGAKSSKCFSIRVDLVNSCQANFQIARECIPDRHSGREEIVSVIVRLCFLFF